MTKKNNNTLSHRNIDQRIDKNIENRLKKYYHFEKIQAKVTMNIYKNVYRLVNDNTSDDEEIMIKAFEELIWFMKNFPDENLKDENTYHDAKRYITFFLTEILIYKCCSTNQCPLDILALNKKLFKYLQSLTIREFETYTSSGEFKCLDRIKADTFNDQEYSFYKNCYNSDSILAELYCNCKKNFTETETSPLILWNEVDKNQWYLKLDDIRKAKKNTLIRLFSYKPNLNKINKYLNSFYNNFLLQDVNTKPINNKLSLYISDENELVNIFEFLLICFYMSKETHSNTICGINS